MIVIAKAILVVFIISCIVVCVSSSLAFAGTWRDNFEDGNLEGWEAAVGNLPVIENGELVFAQGSDICHFVTGEIQWSDYTVQADVKVIKMLGANVPQVGIAARSHLPENWGWYEFLFGWPAGNANLVVNHVAVNGNESLKTMIPFDVKMNLWYNFKMVLKKDHIEAYLDDKLIIQFDDQAESSGKVDLIVWGLETHFDNVVITGPGISDGGSSFDVTTQNKLATIWGWIRSTP